MRKEDLHPLHQAQYGAVKFALGPAAFKRWYDHMLSLKDVPQDQWGEIKISDYKIVTQTDVQQAVSSARQAVAGYSTSNGARKAVEALADALEQII